MPLYENYKQYVSVNYHFSLKSRPICRLIPMWKIYPHYCLETWSKETVINILLVSKTVINTMLVSKTVINTMLASKTVINTMLASTTVINTLLASNLTLVSFNNLNRGITELYIDPISLSMCHPLSLIV